MYSSSSLRKSSSARGIVSSFHPCLRCFRSLIAFCSKLLMSLCSPLEDFCICDGSFLVSLLFTIRDSKLCVPLCFFISIGNEEALHSLFFAGFISKGDSANLLCRCRELIIFILLTCSSSISSDQFSSNSSWVFI
ncbi:unnamed protein product [Moneuplotes crassus]|uniref:Uncharacterized protein n=1 Tax=Euplotes crassus TaxID=5936 RepID=A0AAD1UF74_EUPCR|nr:unnamed protein product [Moneuplotes crassus]